MKVKDIFIGAALVVVGGLALRRCATEVIPSKNADGTETTYSERVGERLVEDIFDFFKGSASGLKKRTQKILDENDINIDSLKGMDKDEILRILEERGVDFDSETAKYPDYLTDPNFDDPDATIIIDPDVPATNPTPN